jgi:hypothetical protein
MFKPEEMTESPMPFTSDSATDLLINPDNLALKLYKEKDGHLLLQSRIEHFYEILEMLIDHQADIVSSIPPVHKIRSIRTKILISQAWLGLSFHLLDSPLCQYRHSCSHLS